MKSYFNFNKSQKIGIITIAIVIVLQIIFLNYNRVRTIPNPVTVNSSEYVFKSEKKYKNKQEESKKQTFSYYPFNPNSFHVDDWMNFGFSQKQAESIVKFKNKINGFKSKEDVKKVYVISEKKYLELDPFIQIESIPAEKIVDVKSNRKNKNTINTDTPKLSVVAELNSASVEDLIKIVGVGEYTAKNIIKYRDKLGGFHSNTQLKEVYAITDENYDLIIQQITIDQSKITKIKVNEWSIPKLKKHPYISWDTAEAMTNQRLKGKLSSLQFLVDEYQLLTQEELLNLMPYIQY